MRSARGFTLIEVLVALAVLALTAAAVTRQSSQVLNDLRRLEEKTQALWLADNELTRIRIEEPWPALGQRSRQMEAMAQDWMITIAVSGTPNVDVRRIDVRVAAAQREQDPLLSITAYAGRH